MTDRRNRSPQGLRDLHLRELVIELCDIVFLEQFCRDDSPHSVSMVTWSLSRVR